MERLFVYGTLAPGKANEHVLGDLPGSWQVATVRGRLVDEGWGAALGSPAIVPDEQAGSVDGFVFSSAALAERWPQLDAFEGSGYRRVRVTARLAEGGSTEAWVYALQSIRESE